MTDQAEAILRQSLDSVDRLRKRSAITFGVTAALSQAAWLGLVFGLRTASEKQTVLLATLALALCVFGGVFMFVLHITRMTHRVLQAIELTTRR